jgi:hypothetical protein
MEVELHSFQSTEQVMIIIEFQRSRLDLCVLNCANDQAKQDRMVMEGMLKVIIQEVENESNQI